MYDEKYKIGIIVGLIFIFIFAIYIILLNHSKVYGQDIDYHDNYINSQETLKAKMQHNVIMCKQKRNNEYLNYKFCRNDLCLYSIEEYSRYIWKFSLEKKLDPWIVASIAYHESNFNAFLIGKKGEKGIFQIHPKNRMSRSSKFIHSNVYRNSCKAIRGHCQEEVTKIAIVILKAAIEHCGSIEGGLTEYNTGKCYPIRKTYVNAVYSIRDKLIDNQKIFGWCSG